MMLRTFRKHYQANFSPMWKQWVNAILGLWVVIIPFTGIAASALTWTLVVTGLVIAVLAFWGVADVSAVEQRGERMAHA